MSFNNRLKNLIIASLFILFLLPALVQSQISLTIGDATGRLGEKLIPLDIRISTQRYEIGGYNIWLQLDRPDLVTFQHGDVQIHDTTFWQCSQYSGAICIDSTLMLSFQDWDFFHVDSSIQTGYLYDKVNYIMPTWFTDLRSLSGFSTDISIVSLNIFGNQFYIAPPQDDELLIRLYLEVVDSLFSPPEDSVVNILFQTDFRDHFSFSTPMGATIGIAPVVYLDSTCYVCDVWADTVCLSWREWNGDPGPIEIDTLNCDSISIVLDTFSVFDSSFWQITNGTFTLLPDCGYTAGSYDIGNLVALVSFMFDNGTTNTLAEADYNCDCEIDIADLVGFVAYMFTSGAVPGCGTQ